MKDKLTKEKGKTHRFKYSRKGKVSEKPIRAQRGKKQRQEVDEMRRKAAKQQAQTTNADILGGLFLYS